MRATLHDIVHDRFPFAEWWVDLPMRRRSWWSEVLREAGAGWLRWKPAWRTRISYEPPDIDQWVVWPPARRAWGYASMWLAHVRHGVIGRQWDWNAWPSLSDMPKDDERKRLFR